MSGKGVDLGDLTAEWDFWVDTVTQVLDVWTGGTGVSQQGVDVDGVLGVWLGGWVLVASSFNDGDGTGNGGQR
ncbi:hypothetical protein WICPIJ_000138 [Wickerhamomyces pijperi]|uniref:Uncharacterized protein n=1 Tax=Wickerhamomyces pijperi TaxID=599730 RepID=A0A9P8TR48_WICPI|nr:hypothetical protein WICPIJ_000138 [Wickerhamomyces pijperi]